MKTIRYIVLAIQLFSLFATSQMAFASGPEYKFWNNYSKQLRYDPDTMSFNIQLDLYYAGLPADKKAPTGSYDQIQSNPNHIKPAELFAKRVLKTNAVMAQYKRPFIFESKVNAQQSGVQQHDNDYRVSFKNLRGYSWGHCSSNTIETFLTVFEHIAQRQNVSNQQLKQWLNIRFELFYNCGKNQIENVTVDKNLLDQHTKGFEIFAYLAASIHFYQAQYTEAIEYFEQVSAAEQFSNPNVNQQLSLRKKDWLTQVSQYLIARSYVEQAKTGKINHKNAQSALKNYLNDYPQGVYRQSAQRLLRKSYYLNRETDNFQQQIKQEFLDAAKNILKEPQFNNEDSEELAGFIKEYTRTHNDKMAGLNTLLSLLDDATMQNNPKHPLTIAVKNIALFKDAHFAYQQGKYQNALDTLKQLHQNMTNHYRFKRPKYHQILEAKTLAKLGRFEQSNQIYTALSKVISPNRTQPLIADNLVKQGGLQQLLNSPIELNKAIYQRVLASTCSSQQIVPLLSQVEKPHRLYWIIYDLADRYLAADNIKALHQLLSRYTQAQLRDFALIKTAAKMVATNSDNENIATNKEQLAKGYMNIAYFMENKLRRPDIHELHNRQYQQTKHKDHDKQCDRAYLKPSTTDPYYYYQKALTHVVQPSELEAKILHFLVQCHKAQDLTKACRWMPYLPYNHRIANPLANPSKQWFERLHQQYKDSSWANKTPYYFDN